MATGDLVTEDWGFEYRGFAFGGTSDLLIAPGTTGLWDTPEVRTSDQPRFRRHGSYPGDDWLGTREIIIPIEISGADTATWTTHMDAIRTAFAVDPEQPATGDPLVFQVPGVAGGGKRIVYARPRGLSAPIDQAWFYSIPVVSARFVATDPHIYDAAATTVISPILVGTSSGALWPFTWPLTWGVVAPTTFSTTNSGSARAEWTATITGPTTNPEFVNTDQLKTVAFTYDLVAGDTLVIDSDARTATLNGSINLYSSMTTKEWFTLAPGANSLSFRATAGSGTLTLAYRNTWA